MITYKTGNLLEADAEALVNTVNTVGVMGKGIALMFKERFPDNFKAYAAACKAGEVVPGKMFVTPSNELTGPKWIINFPTKKHWRYPSKPEWIEDGLEDLKKVIADKGIQSVAMPPLGCGNGGLEWSRVKATIEDKLASLEGVEVVAFEPTAKYQNVAKRTGVQQLTIPRALIAEAIRRYWVLGIECTMLEIQKLAWFIERVTEHQGLDNPLDLQYQADRYGPYSNRLNHLLNALDGSYLRSTKRIADCGPTDTIAFADQKTDKVAAYLGSGDARPYQSVMEKVDSLIDGFQSPFGLELLATVDWLLHREKCEPTIEGIRKGLASWKGPANAGERKQRLFNDKVLALALGRLKESGLAS